MNIYKVTYVEHGSYFSTESGSMNLGPHTVTTTTERFITITAGSLETAEAVARELYGRDFRKVEFLSKA